MENVLSNIISHNRQNQTFYVEKIFFREKLDIKLIVYHNADGDSARSMAEGKTTRIRLIGPKFVDFDPNSDTFTSNYTLDGTANDGVTFEKGPQIGGKSSGIPTDIQFTNGLKFADFVSINFTMSVDKDGIRPVGAGNMETAVVLHPLCIQNVFESYPTDNDTTYVSCGSLSSRPFISDSAGIFVYVVYFLTEIAISFCFTEENTFSECHFYYYNRKIRSYSNRRRT